MFRFASTPRCAALLAASTLAGGTLVAGFALANKFHLAPVSDQVAASCSELCLNPVSAIPMGETEMKGGTTKIGEIDPAAIPGSGPDAAGKVCNKIPGGTSISDLTFSIKKGTASTVDVEGVTGTTNFDAQGTANVQLDPAQGGNVCLGYTIKQLGGDSSGANLVCNVTPSFEQAVDEVVIEMNSLPGYYFDQMADVIRNGVAETYHEGVLAFIVNDDPSEQLIAISGTVTFPTGSGVVLSDVRLAHPDGSLYATASTSFTDTTFVISSFGGLDPTDSCRVVMKLSGSLEGRAFRALLSASYDQ